MENGTLRFSPPSEFNDAFEFLPSVANFNSPFWRRNTEEILEPELKKVYATLQAANLRLRFDSFDQFKQHSLEQLFADSSEFKARMINAVMGVTGSGKIGVLCFSSVAPDETDAGLLWAHYGDEHEGFAIEFDSSHPFVTQHAETNVGVMTARYVDCSSPQRPTWDANTTVIDFMYRKSPAWGYEKEYRMTRVLDDPRLDMRPDSKGVMTLANFPSDLILGVTFGVRCATKTKKSLLEILTPENFPRAKIFQAKFHDELYQLESVPFDSGRHLLEYSR